MTLYEIAGVLIRLEDLLESGEIDGKTYDDTLDAYLRDATADKVEAYCKAIREREARAAAKQTEINRLRAAKNIDDQTVAKLKERLHWFLETTGQRSIDGGIFRVAIVSNGGALALEVDPEVVEDASKAGEAYCQMVPTLDTEAIRKALAEGQELPFARLKPRGTHLTIR